MSSKKRPMLAPALKQLVQHADMHTDVQTVSQRTMPQLARQGRK